MQVRVTAADPARTAADVLALPLFELDPKKWRLPSRLARLDRALGGRLAAVLSTGDFRGKVGDTLALYPDGAIRAKRILLVGLGPEAKADAEALRRGAGSAVGGTAARRGEQLALVAPALRRLRPPAVARALAEGAVLAGYRFDAFKEKQEEEAPRPVRSVTLLWERAPDARSARRGAEIGAIVAESQNVARDLSNQPGNALAPVALARAAQRVAREAGLRCRVLGPNEMRRRKMGAILAVGQGSSNPPRLIVLEHGTRRAPNARRGRPTLCLVGKGVTFDSGGISIKPAAGMGDMKHDMSGAAAVVGTLRAAALLRLPLHVVGVIGAAENMPSGTAYRPGDLVRAMSGKTIEVVNTDAEGRVVLADALHFACTEYAPDAIVDLATLTGACVIALGG
jgi:leucyl aminopeptidase